MNQDDHRKFIAKLLKTRTSEAPSWLRSGSPKSFRNLGEMPSTEESIAYVERLYEAGAVQVIAVEIYRYGLDENTGQLLVQMPIDPEKRRRLFALERAHAELQGFDGESDFSQEYLYFKLD